MINPSEHCTIQSLRHRQTSSKLSPKHHYTLSTRNPDFLCIKDTDGDLSTSHAVLVHTFLLSSSLSPIWNGPDSGEIQCQY